MQRYALIVLRFRLPIALLALILVALCVAAAPGVRLDFSVFPLLEANREARRQVDEFYRDLPPQPVDAVCLLEWSDPIGAPEVEVLGSLTRVLEGVPGVRSAVSLATTRVIETRGGIPIPRPLRERIGERPAIEEVRRHPLLEGKLLSRDGRAAAILLVKDGKEEGAGGGGEGEGALGGGARAGASRAGWIDRAREAVRERLPPGVTVRFIGPEIVEGAMARSMWRDMIRSIVLEVACFLVLLPLLFRTVRSVVVPLLVVGSAVLLDFGFLRLFDLSLSLIEVAVPGLITIIGLCDTIHMLHRFEEAVVSGASRRDAILVMMDRVGMACLYTSLTTALGFFALLVADHRAVRDFAVSASIAVLITFVCVITLLPLMLSFWPVRGRSPGGIPRFVRLAYGWRGGTFALFGGLAAICALGTFRIRVGSRWLHELPESAPAVRDLHWYQERFGGFLFMDVRLDGPLDRVKSIRAVDRLERRLLAEEGIDAAESYTDWIREVLGNPTGAIGDERLLAGLLYLKLAGATGPFPSHVVTVDFRKGRIRFRTRDVATRRFLGWVRLVEEQARGLPEGLHARVAGFSRMAHESSRLVVTTMMLSLLVSLGTISIFIMVIYDSVKLGLLCLVPNAIPILAALGLTGWFGIPLRIGIVMIYSLGVGLAVDNTIHLVTRYIQERRSDPRGSLRDHLSRSLQTTGSALVASSAVLVLGALCYLPASFRSMSDVGILLSTMVVVALVTDVYLVPHLLEVCGGPGGRGRGRGAAFLGSGVATGDDVPDNDPATRKGWYTS